MIAGERIKEADRNVKQYIADGLLRIKDESIKKFTGFFMRNAESSLQTAALLYQISRTCVSSL
jgi:predicted nucleotidyltransferase